MITGGCHCGAVRFEASVPAEVIIDDCNCSICAKAGFLHLIVPHGDFTLISGAEALTSYRFGTGAAEHLFCKTCGIKSFYQPRSHPECWSINWRCVDTGHGITATIRAFDGQNWEAARVAVYGLDAAGDAADAAFVSIFGRAAPEGLSELRGLTPGDLAVVARQLRYAEGEVSDVDLVARLAAELNAKPESGSRIGF